MNIKDWFKKMDTYQPQGMPLVTPALTRYRENLCMRFVGISGHGWPKADEQCVSCGKTWRAHPKHESIRSWRESHYT